MASRFEVRDDFYLDGKKFKFISGAIHYFRVVPAYWRDRLEKLKAMGCNTVETYVPWNLHEPREGIFCFEGFLDLAGFIKIAQQLGLWVIVRPSPYICAEWEFGGLPAWLLAEDGIRVRCADKGFLRRVDAYYKKLFAVLSPLQVDSGGPILMMQLENEYGSFGSDQEYLKALLGLMKKHGTSVPVFTSDSPDNQNQENGGLPGVLHTGNFGSKAKKRFRILKQHTSGGPLMCMEFWVGWFDNWGCGKHHTSNYKENAADLDDILSQGSVNIYMFQGGTNFGFTNGSNYYGRLSPDVTSYDYDAVLTEDGQITPKYQAFQSVIEKYAPVKPVTFSTKIERADYGMLQSPEKVSLFCSLDLISSSHKNSYPLCMEKLGQSYGYTLYRSVLKSCTSVSTFRLFGANDRAQIFLNERPRLTLYDRELLKARKVKWKESSGATLDILIENMGRVNYGPYLNRQRKGIDGEVLLNGCAQSDWHMYPLALDNVDKLDYSREFQEGTPSFYRFHWAVELPADTFVDMTGWGKGCVFVNGFHLGRFWEEGPQKRLYLPAPLLHSGENELVVFETEGKAPCVLDLKSEPMLE